MLYCKLICSTIVLFLQNLKMKISHPRFLNAGKRESLDMDFPACLEKNTDYEWSCIQANSNDMSQSVFIFPEVSSHFLPCASYYLYQIWINPFFVLWVLGYNYTRGNTIFMASLVSSCWNWKYFLVYNHILWDGRGIKHHEIPHSTHAS